MVLPEFALGISKFQHTMSVKQLVLALDEGGGPSQSHGPTLGLCAK